MIGILFSFKSDSFSVKANTKNERILIKLWRDEKRTEFNRESNPRPNGWKASTLNTRSICLSDKFMEEPEMKRLYLNGHLRWIDGGWWSCRVWYLNARRIMRRGHLARNRVEVVIKMSIKDIFKKITGKKVNKIRKIKWQKWH